MRYVCGIYIYIYIERERERERRYRNRIDSDLTNWIYLLIF